MRNISADRSLKDVLAEKIPKEIETVKAFRKQHGNTKVGEVTVDMVSNHRKLPIDLQKRSCRTIWLTQYAWHTRSIELNQIEMQWDCSAQFNYGHLVERPFNGAMLCLWIVLW